MASNPWTPAHRAARQLDISREELHRLRDTDACKLGHHYGAGSLTRSKDSYYWHVPCMKQLLSTQKQVSCLALNSQMFAA